MQRLMLTASASRVVFVGFSLAATRRRPWLSRHPSTTQRVRHLNSRCAVLLQYGTVSRVANANANGARLLARCMIAMPTIHQERPPETLLLSQCSASIGNFIACSTGWDAVGNRHEVAVGLHRVRETRSSLYGPPQSTSHIQACVKAAQIAGGMTLCIDRGSSALPACSAHIHAPHALGLPEQRRLVRKPEDHNRVALPLCCRVLCVTCSYSHRA